jgi:hypothetical protein
MKCSKRDPTYAQCYSLIIKLGLSFPQHVSANSYAIIREYYYNYLLKHVGELKVWLKNGNVGHNLDFF